MKCIPSIHLRSVSILLGATKYFLNAREYLKKEHISSGSFCRIQVFFLEGRRKEVDTCAHLEDFCMHPFFTFGLFRSMLLWGPHRLYLKILDLLSLHKDRSVQPPRDRGC